MEGQQSDDDIEKIALGQARLSGDAARLHAYAEQHPQGFGMVRWQGARLEISFVDPDRHRAGVRSLVEHPDLVDVVPALFTERQLCTVRTAVDVVLAQNRDSWLGVGNGVDHVSVQLRPGGLQIAERLWQDHGDAVRITVGGHDYPLDPEAVADEQRPPGTEQSEPWPVGLTVQVELGEVGTPAGGTVHGQLLLRTTTQPVTFESDQPLDAELLDHDGRRVNGLAGFRVGTGRFWQLAPGEHGRVAFFAGTDSARLADGPVMAPGTWQLVVPIPVHRQTPNGLVTTRLLAGPVPVTLTQPEPGPVTAASH